MSLKIGIIDDEMHAIETLVFDLEENFAGQVEIVFSSTDPVEGIKLIKKNKPDLLFLDVEMPRLSGIDVLEIIDDMELKVVVTTAHQDFAVQAVGTRAIAYLLKPVQMEQLEAIIENIQQVGFVSHPIENERLAVPVFDGIEIVPVPEIIYCKSEGNYTKLFFSHGKKLLASKTLKYFTEILPARQFMRIHKSYLINLRHMKKYLNKDGGEVMMANGDILPVSRSRRDELLKLIQNNH
ncbi:MAG: LytR/AlgR family response regulator transcription factor [Draconibacterium sp.]